MRDIMIDLEALDSRNTAIVVSLGAVYFDTSRMELGDEFYMECSYDCQDQYDKGRTFSFDTFRWWMAQGDVARSVFLPSKDPEDVSRFKQRTEHLLHAFSAFVQKADGGKARVWGNGATYDNVVMRSLYNTYNIKCPWAYSNDLCYRSVKNLFGNRAKLERVGTHHNGLDDAKTQAVHMMQMLKAVRG